MGETILMSAVSLRNVEPGLITVNASGKPAVVTAVILINASLEPPINV